MPIGHDGLSIEEGYVALRGGDFVWGVPAGCLDLGLGGTFWAGRSSFSRFSSAMARELALPSPPFDLGRALEQGVCTILGLLKILCGGGIWCVGGIMVVGSPRPLCCCCSRSSRMVMRSVLLLLLLSSRCVVNAVGPLRRKCSGW